MSPGAASYRGVRAELIAGALLLFFLCASGWLLWSRQAALLGFAYPGIALVIGGWLYISRPSLYLGFTWWIWFITPFVRRIVDFEVGYFNPTNPVMLTPFLVTGISFLTVLRFGKLLRQRTYFPFLLVMLGIIYGYLVGAVKVGLLSATFSLLEWLIPVFFGFHALAFWQEYPEHRSVVRATFTWGVLLMGVYGVFQLIYPPPWDMFWLVESGMTSSMGNPEAFGFRVFSTLNSTGTFASIMVMGLLFLFDGKGFIAHAAAVPGYISFLLSLVRALWGGWVVGVMCLIMLMKGQLRKRLIGFLAVGVVIGVPLVLYAPGLGAENIRHRAETFANLEEDGSYRARVGLHFNEAFRILTDPIGQGIGGIGPAAKLSTGQRSSFDSGILGIPLSLGWPGTFLLVWGLIWMLRSAFRNRSWQHDRFAVIAMAIALVNIFLLLFKNNLTVHGGCGVWSFLGLVLAAQAYYDTLEAEATQ